MIKWTESDIGISFSESEVKNVTDLKKTIAKNISELRRKAGLTQLDLAERLNYSDKAVSKWESGASVPDVGVLLEIANLFGVTVDYLLHDEHEICTLLPSEEKEKGRRRKRLVITLLSVALVWFIATAAFVVLLMCGSAWNNWLTFAYAVPISSIVLIVLNSVWGNKRRNYLYISVLTWSLIAAIYLTAIAQNYWQLFILGVPGQIIICLWAGMKKVKR